MRLTIIFGFIITIFISCSKDTNNRLYNRFIINGEVFGVDSVNYDKINDFNYQISISLSDGSIINLIETSESNKQVSKFICGFNCEDPNSSYIRGYVEYNKFIEGIRVLRFHKEPYSVSIEINDMVVSDTINKSQKILKINGEWIGVMKFL